MKTIQPHWPAPQRVHAYTTTRLMGNLAIQQNRDELKEKLQLPNEPLWLMQTHSAIVLNEQETLNNRNADALYTNKTQQVCVILTADCLPILLCDQAAQEIAAVHAGWRGLVNGIIENTLQKFTAPSETLLAWIGPHISATQYEIGADVRNILLEKAIQIDDAIQPHRDRWLANLSLIASRILQQQGIKSVYISDYCTFQDKNFFSYRRDGEKAGRQASLIWLA
ncbi:MAG: peptidoglycan editing factor PgeF [Gammaproteobacteria bacterium]|nr:peptidoglycan editing factor PgeF [Gammaproteobacteria bacterium]